MSDRHEVAQHERREERGEAMLDQIKETNALSRRAVEAAERQAESLAQIAKALEGLIALQLAQGDSPLDAAMVKAFFPFKR